MVRASNYKIQMFVSDDMGHDIETYAKLMGLTRNEYIRYSIAQMNMTYKTALNKINELKASDFVKEN